ncbi:MAG: SCO family protein [Planctomycetota bacterium]
MKTLHRTDLAAGLRAALAAACATLAVGAVAFGQKVAEFVPPSARETGVTQKVGEELPLDTVFTTTDGERHPLSDFFGDGKPVLITFNYSNCPQLCSLQLDGVAGALRELEYAVGDDFRVLTVSIDPKESPERAGLTRERYFHQYLRADDARTDKSTKRTEARAAELGDEPGTTFDWHFLTGDADAIAAVTDAAGFAFRLDPNTGEYAHDAVLIVATPDGKISRYLPGVVYEPRDISLSLVSASQGELGGVVAWTRMFCYRWDPDAGTYVRSAERIMVLSAGACAFVLFSFLAFMWYRDLASRRDQQRENRVALSTGSTTE